MEVFCYIILSITGIAVIVWILHSLFTHTNNYCNRYTRSWDYPMYTSYSFKETRTETIGEEPDESQDISSKEKPITKDGGTPSKGKSNEIPNNHPTDCPPKSGESGSHTCEG